VNTKNYFVEITEKLRKMDDKTFLELLIKSGLEECPNSNKYFFDESFIKSEHEFKNEFSVNSHIVLKEKLNYSSKEVYKTVFCNENFEQSIDVHRNIKVA